MKMELNTDLIKKVLIKAYEKEKPKEKLIIRELLKDGKIKTLDDLNNLFKSIIKDLTEECYQGEIEEELGYPNLRLP